MYKIYVFFLLGVLKDIIKHMFWEIVLWYCYLCCWIYGIKYCRITFCFM